MKRSMFTARGIQVSSNFSFHLSACVTKLTMEFKQVRAIDIIRVSTYNKTFAFTLSLMLTLFFNYSGSLSHELTKNEFLPSVRETIAGFYPNKAIFQILIAVQSFLQFIVNITIVATLGQKSKSFRVWSGIINLLRSISLLGFTYVTFEDSPNGFNNFYVIYLLSNLAWMHLLDTRLESRVQKHNDTRRQIKYAYGISLVNASLFFYYHQVQNVQYAYSASAFFQWVLIHLDIYLDDGLKNELKHVFFKINFLDNIHKHIV